jgi:hypothetical protein
LKTHTLLKIPEEDADEKENHDELSAAYRTTIIKMEICNDSFSTREQVPVPPPIFSPTRTNALSFDFHSSNVTTKVPSYSDTKGKILKQLRISDLDIPSSKTISPGSIHEDGIAVKRSNSVHASCSTPMTPITPVSINIIPGVQHSSSASTMQDNIRIVPLPWLSIPPINTGSAHHERDHNTYQSYQSSHTAIERSYSADYSHATNMDHMVYRRKLRSGSGGGSGNGTDGSITAFHDGSEGENSSAKNSAANTPTMISYPTAEDLDEYWSCQYCTFSHYGKATALLQQCSVCHTPRNALHNTNTVYSPFLSTPSTATTPHTPSTTNAPLVNTPSSLASISQNSHHLSSLNTNTNHLYDIYPLHPSYHLPQPLSSPAITLPPILSFGTISSDLPIMENNSEEGMHAGGEDSNMRSLTVETVAQCHEQELFTEKPVPHSELSDEFHPTTTVTKAGSILSSSSSTHSSQNMMIYDDALRTFSAEF